MIILLGPGFLTWDGAIFRFGEGGIRAQFLNDLREISAEEFGRFDSVQTGRSVKITGKLWSGWENLSLVLPSSAFNPTIGGQIFSGANLPAVIHGQDGSQLTVYNVQITKLANLMLSVGKELWSADIEFTGLVKSGSTPDQAGAYYAYTIGNAYAPPAFVKSNFRAPIISATWAGTLTNGGTSFGAFSWKNGAAVDWKWDLDLEPCKVDGYGAVNAVITGFEGSCKGTPIGVLEADAATGLLPAQALGVLLSTNAGDLVNTFGANYVTLKQAFMSNHEGFAWSVKNNRIGDLTFRTTVPFVAGNDTARAAAA